VEGERSMFPRRGKGGSKINSEWRGNYDCFHDELDEKLYAENEPWPAEASSLLRRFHGE